MFGPLLLFGPFFLQLLRLPLALQLHPLEKGGHRPPLRSNPPIINPSVPALPSVALVADPCLPSSRRKVIQIERVALDVVASGQVIQSLDHGIHTDEALGCRLRLGQRR